MPDKQYELMPAETQQVEELKSRIARHGGLFACDEAGELLLDVAGRPSPLEYFILRTRRFLIDHAGQLWRLFGEGSRKNPSAPDGGGAPWRNNRIEMWNGRWRKVKDPNGQVKYEKALTSRPIDKRINGQPGISQIDFYRSRGYRHPFDEPHQPSPQEVAALNAPKQRGDFSSPPQHLAAESLPLQPAKANSGSAPSNGTKHTPKD